PAIMSGTVRDDLLERLRQPELVEHQRGDLVDAGLDSGSHVIGLTDSPTVDDGDNGATVIDDVDPLPAVLLRGIDRELLAVEGTGGEERQNFLRELVRPVVVGAV